MPSYSDTSLNLSDRREVAALIAGECGLWNERVERGSEEPFDGILIAQRALAGSAVSHIGMVVEIGKMIHVDEGRESRIERYDTGMVSRRVVGFYRYRR